MHKHDCFNEALCISNIELFKNLDMKQQKNLYLSARHLDVDNNQVVFHANDRIDQIIIIRYGKIKSSFYDSNGNEYISNVYIEGDTIGEDSIFLNRNYEVDGVTIGKTGICMISMELIKNTLSKDKEFALKMIENLSMKLDRSEKMLEIISIRDSYKRLATFLLYRSQRLKSNTISLNQENIASSINMTRETASRKLSQLKAEGIIDQIGYKEIKIVNRPALIKLVKV